jgi:hypothetical protein
MAAINKMAAMAIRRVGLETVYPRGFTFRWILLRLDASCIKIREL